MISLNLPSGQTLQQWVEDGEALVNSVDGTLLPADAQTLVQLGEKLLNALLAAGFQRTPVLQSEVDAEQVAAAAAVDAKFGSGT